MKAKLINRDAEVAIHYLVPFPGTEIYDIAIKNGYIPPANLKDWADFMFKRFDPPWLKNKHRRKIELFNKIYFPLIDPSLYKIAFSGVFFVFIINKIYYPIVYLRFRFSCLIFPVEAIALLYLIKFINKIFKSNYHLDSGYSKYID
jgi:hypothetical protein